MPKTSVRSSSVDKSAAVATVALVGTIKAPPEGVVDYYKTSMEAQGFKLAPARPLSAMSPPWTSSVVTARR
ncbi:hypothetical protein ACQW07_21445 [Paenarthrobacter nitroguajacolicus]|uniref:hypothetical protein n=1 Tax=Paenarthrobacter nitroguajacolicus TaxID=211146 RepID=UPI003D1A6F24